jgi:hypothetical protein
MFSKEDKDHRIAYVHVANTFNLIAYVVTHKYVWPVPMYRRVLGQCAIAGRRIILPSDL